MCAAIASTNAGTNGGFASNDPSLGHASKKEPSDPNGASVSGNAEQKRWKRQLSGLAKHSAATPNRRVSTAKARSLSAAWKPPHPSAS